MAPGMVPNSSARFEHCTEAATKRTVDYVIGAADVPNRTPSACQRTDPRTIGKYQLWTHKVSKLHIPCSKALAHPWPQSRSEPWG